MLVVAVCALGFVGTAYLLAGGAPPEKPVEKDIVQTLTDNGNYKTLCDLITAAGLADTLKGKGPYTVLAPNDDAFKKLPAGTVDTLKKPENKDKLKALLLYHVVEGKLMVADMKKMKTLKTLNGAEITVTVKEDKLTLNGTTMITAADGSCSNGVLQGIDTVLSPPEKPAPPKDAPVK
jgi:uncharacterized surface protein with fasciclin (FAS1) repeats